VAVGADGTLYVAWHRIKSTSSSQIQFVKSVNGGLTWSTPASVAVETTQAFLPTVAVSPAGTVGVTYFDFRNDVPGDPELTTDRWFRHSHDGGATWSETHVAGPFDFRTAPYTGGDYPLGGYYGLAPIGRTGFGAAWIQTITPRTQGATDAFFARLRVSPRP
jgi:Neuraminidase (sialidase)